MSDDADLDVFIKAISKSIDTYFADLAKIMKKIEADAAEKAKAEKARAAAEEKAQAEDQKKADALSESLRKKIFSIPPPKKLDPSQGPKITDLILKHFDKNGVKVSDTITVGADVDFDVKKMKFNKFVPTVTITFP